MVRGTQKQIIHLKHTESALFEEAFLILKPTSATPPGGCDMVAEAERLLSRHRDEPAQGGAEKTRRFPPVLAFLAGLLSGALIPLLFL